MSRGGIKIIHRLCGGQWGWYTGPAELRGSGAARAEDVERCDGTRPLPGDFFNETCPCCHKRIAGIGELVRKAGGVILQTPETTPLINSPPSTKTPLSLAKARAKEFPWSQLTTDERTLLLGSKQWRLNNLYWIRDKKGAKVKFKMNLAQRTLFKNIWYLNICCKARQLGFCLDPETRVLTASLEWVKIKDMAVGTEIVSVDEHPPGGTGQSRKMRTGVVRGVVKVQREAYRITFDDGRSVICTGKHPWLSKNVNSMAEWRTIEKKDSKKKLRVGTKVRWITKPWGEATFEDGWFGGVLDGEGSISKRNSSAEINVSQRPGVVWDRMVKYCEDNGFNHCYESDKAERPSKFGKTPVPKISFGRMDEMFRVIGKTRPARFIGNRFWEGRELPGKRNGGVGWATITEITPLGEMELIDLQTSTGTYIAEGFVSHNTTFIDLYLLDECLFNSGVEAGIIAHNLDDVSKIFRRKIQFPYENLPEEIRNTVWPTTDSKTEMTFSNGSTISVGVSFRSGTCQYLHISEYGKICAKFPDKAEEIRTGALEAVAVGQMVFIESTAEGRGGDFAEQVKIARKHQDEGTPLTEMDYRLHFFPWFMDPTYHLDEYVLITTEWQQYFEDLRRMHGIELTVAQKNWYVKKAAKQGDKMNREYPSTIDECFMAAVKGAYWAKEIQILRQQRRIGVVPHDPSLLVHTGWDLGRNDSNPIWFFQYYGGQFRFIDYYENSGKSIAHYVQVMREKSQKLKYNYGWHYLPHDVAVTDLSQENDLSRKQVLERLGVVNIVMVKRESDLRNQEGVDSVRMILPRSWFDKEKCDKGLACLESYSLKWDEKRGEASQYPEHNWACLVKGTLINTPVGPKAVDEFVIGDHVLICGISAEVVRTKAVGVQRISLIYLPNRVSVRCSEGHKFFTRRGLVRAVDLTAGDHILTEPGVEKWSADSRGILGAFIESSVELNTDFGRRTGFIAARLAGSLRCCTASCGSTETGQLLRRMLLSLSAVIGKISLKTIGFAGHTQRTEDVSRPSTTGRSMAGLSSGKSLRQGTTGQKPQAQPSICTGMSGREKKGLYQRAWLSIISTTTRQITKLTTSLCYARQNTQTTTHWREVLALESLPLEMVYDIEVEHHHAYVLSESGVVTSNSHGASAMIQIARGFQEQQDYSAADVDAEEEAAY